jgi:hypothetical protein
MNYPLMYRIQQRFDTTSIEDVPEAIGREFSRLDVGKNVQPGQRVAVAVGSRGIHNLSTIVATVIACLRKMDVSERWD